MKAVFSDLKAWGCDVDGALARFLDDEDMYMEFLVQVPDDEAVEKLGEAIAKGDTKEAFEMAHMLKGVHGNLGVNPLYELDCKIVEPLRAGELAGVPEAYEKLVEANRQLKEILK